MSLSGPSVALQDRLRSIFDAQVMNYGAYNLVCAPGDAISATEGSPAEEHAAAGHFLVGYRRGPVELIIAPFDPKTLEPLSPPIAVDNTNMLRGEALTDRSILLETTSGTRFRLEISPLIAVPTAAGDEVLEQEADVADLLEFLAQLFGPAQRP